MNHKMSLPMLTRRTFLKASAATAALVAAGDVLLGQHSTLVPNAKAAAPKEEGWFPGHCKMCVQGDCFERVKVVDGVVVKVEGDPRAPNNQGALCVRGNASIMQMYNPWRVKAPMKRTNPTKALNADPKWVEISWDEALQTIGDRLKAVRADNPKKYVMITGQAFNSMMFGPFLRAYGVPENDIPARGVACAYHWASTYVHGESPDAVMDIARSDYIISVGRSIGPNYCIASGASRAFLDAIDRGCKIVTVDPRGSPEAAKGEWVPIKPGTDQAFMLGMLNTMLYEIGYKKLDVWSIKNRTNGPYLIGPDGDYVRDVTAKKPLIWDEVENRPRTFDEIPPMNSALEGTYTVNGVQATPAFQLVKAAVKDNTAEWAEKISMVPAGTIRRLTKEFIDHAKIGATITIDGVTMPYRPVGIQYERGAFAHTIEGVFGDLVGKIICELVGCLEVPGGVTGNKWPGPSVIGPDADGVVKPQGEAAASGKDWKWPPTALDARTFYPMSHTAVNLWAKGVVDPATYYLQNNTEAVASWCGNPIHSCFSIDTFEKAFAKIPFHFAMELVYNEAAMMADIVLPDQSHLEKMHWQPLQGTQQHRVAIEETRAYRGFHFRDSSKITKPYNARSGDEVALDIAERVGILYGKDGLIDQINQRALPVPLVNYKLDLNTKPTMLQISEGYLKEKFDPNLSIADVNDARGPIYMYETRGAKLHNYFYWPNNKTRHPMYMVQLLRVAKLLKENMAKAGLTDIPGWTDQAHYWAAYQAIPVWTPCPEYDAPPEYDLWALNWKTMPHPYGTGDTYGNVWIHEVMMRFNPYEYAVWMNADTAAKKGLKDGDIVVVESRYGKTQGRLKATQLIHPTAVGIPGIAGYRSQMENPVAGEGPYFNILCPFDEKDLAVDPISGGIEEGPAVKVYKA